MTLPIAISHSNWSKLNHQLSKDYPLSVMLIKRLKIKTLGFTSRHHASWYDEDHKQSINCIMLDFYSEKKRTFFIMKYGEYLNK